MNKKYKQLKYRGKTITDSYDIEQVLIKEEMAWFIDAETSDVNIEILNGTLIFNGGVWYSGVWKFGAFRNGEWRFGTWEGGVWFNGKWYDGRFEGGIIFNGEFLNGEILSAKLRKNNQDGSETTLNFNDCVVSNSVISV
jgi:hypothetical protein